MKKPYLDIQHLDKHFGTYWALKEISLAIEQGEFICFLGPSGCGKTTLLRTIAGLEFADSGSIWQAGKNISALPPQQRDFGIVFQSYALFPNLTAAQNIAFGLENQRLDKLQVQKAVHHWLDLVGLQEQSHKYPNQLSGGQQQRIALARALALSPGLLLLDEPLSALDALVRTHLRTEIRALQQRLGITTIMVTHDQEEALSMADRIVVMDQGRIVQVGTPWQIYHQPVNRFVANFVGSMNFIEALVVNEQHIRLDDQILALNHQANMGEKLAIAIRPEMIDIAPAHQQGLKAQIEQIEFLGASERIICTAQTYLGPQRLTLVRPPHYRQSQSLTWQQGMDCRLSWPQGAMHLL